MKRMKRTILTVATASLVATGFCNEIDKDKAALLLQRTGGFVIKLDSAKGKVAVFNAQQAYDASVVRDAASMIGDEFHYVVEVIDNSGAATTSNASAILARSGAGAGVFLVNGEAEAPAIVAAPDNNWAMVNVSAFGKNDALLKKQVLRAFAMGAGGHLSQTPISLMGPFRNPKQIAAIPTNKLPVDTIGKVIRNLKECGVEQYMRATYLKACREGWAPQPTNEIQRAIWNKVHTIPDKPITIEYDPKKDK